MKRLVWLLTTVCCLAFAQVQPVALPGSGAEGCDCCCRGQDCGCSLPGCALPAPVRAPVHAQIAVRPALVQTASRATPPRTTHGFFHVFATPVSHLMQRLPAPRLSPPAGPAVFLVLCRFLI